MRRDAFRDSEETQHHSEHSRKSHAYGASSFLGAAAEKAID